MEREVHEGVPFINQLGWLSAPNGKRPVLHNSAVQFVPLDSLSIFSRSVVCVNCVAFFGMSSPCFDMYFFRVSTSFCVLAFPDVVLCLFSWACVTRQSPCFEEGCAGPNVPLKPTALRHLHPPLGELFRSHQVDAAVSTPSLQHFRLIFFDPILTNASLKSRLIFCSRNKSHRPAKALRGIHTAKAPRLQ